MKPDQIKTQSGAGASKAASIKEVESAREGGAIKSWLLGLNEDLYEGRFLEKYFGRIPYFKNIFLGAVLLTVAILVVFDSMSSRAYWLYLVTSYAMGFFFYVFTRQFEGEKTFKRFAEMAFSRKIWLHPSAINDYIFLAISVLLVFKLLDVFVIDMMYPAAFTGFLASKLGIEPQETAPGWWVIALYTLAYLLVSDFARYISHYMQHRIPALWEFHKVHHSAKTLTPFTVFRNHPLELFIKLFLMALGIGIVAGPFYYMYPGMMTLLTIMGVHVGLFAFNIFGANLRHSTVPIRYGRFLEHIFISPYQHQIHHSVKVRHYDKNFGSLFAFWDWMFGTLCIEEKEELAYGLSTEQEEKPFRSVWGMFFYPFIGSYRVLRKHFSKGQPKTHRDD